MTRPGFQRTLLATLVLAGASLPAQAALIDRGGGLIYDSDLNITWLANANLGAGSAYDDGVSTTDGYMTWQAAANWAASLSYFDSVRSVTYDDWRLPSTVQPDATCSDLHGGLFSSGTGCTGSEMGHLFYVELSGTAYSSVLGSGDPDLAKFSNVQGDGYWSGTLYAPDTATFAHVFNMGYGLQAPDQKVLGYYAWAVRDGDVGTVPVPATGWLIASALTVLAGARRRARR